MKKTIVQLLVIVAVLSSLLPASYAKLENNCKTVMTAALDAAIKRYKQETWEMNNIPVSIIYEDKEKESPNQIVIQSESGTVIHERKDVTTPSYDERWENIQHSYLALKYPFDVHRLDSIFKDELNRRGIFAQTAVIYTYKDSIHQKSRLDSVFYRSSFHTNDVVLGVMDEIRFQGLVRLTPDIVMSQKHWGRVIIVACGVIFLFGCMLVIRWLRKEKSTPSAEEVKHETKPLLETIVLDCKKFLLIYGRKEIKITQLMCKFFKLLKETSGYYLEYEQIIDSLYKKLDLDTGKDRLFHLAKRIRDEILVDIPVLNIRAVKGKGFVFEIREGYKLNINND